MHRCRKNIKPTSAGFITKSGFIHGNSETLNLCSCEDDNKILNNMNLVFNNEKI